jgi:hypothetical protein
MVDIPSPKKQPVVQVHDLSKPTGRLKPIGGSKSDEWNNNLANDTIQTLWFKNSSADEAKRQRHAAIDALIGIAPRDELEGMMGAQLIAAHHAAMECYRRAMIGEQTFEGRRENLSQANKLSRTFATLLEALNRHRGKGQQKVTVEHVHVHSGGQAVVGVVQQKSHDKPIGATDAEPHSDAKSISHAPQPPVWSANAQRTPVPISSDAERALPNARRSIPGSAKGE